MKNEALHNFLGVHAVAEHAVQSWEADSIISLSAHEERVHKSDAHLYT